MRTRWLCALAVLAAACSDSKTVGSPIEAGGSAVVEYTYQLFRGRFGVYGGDLFVGAGLWALWYAHREDRI